MPSNEKTRIRDDHVGKVHQYLQMNASDVNKRVK